ncbi:Uncharacterized protein TCM_036464 [Theobroma cacao]|uniref:Uncharacterized protein n=1 Tax=Theobroma cacao TaxID=3641 RepID=A0A061FJQ5_THECC|nr:Uncharacterized protein TCM_036464 [Theobroma cacao]
MSAIQLTIMINAKSLSRSTSRKTSTRGSQTTPASRWSGHNNSTQASKQHNLEQFDRHNMPARRTKPTHMHKMCILQIHVLDASTDLGHKGSIAHNPTTNVSTQGSHVTQGPTVRGNAYLSLTHYNLA